MPGSNSIASLTSKSQRLLAAIAQNADRLQAAEPHRVELEQALKEFQELLVRRDNFKADKQVLSRQLAESSLRVTDALIDLKALVKALLGSKSEKLTEFQVQPRRKRTVSDRDPRKAAARSSSKQQGGEAAAPGPTAVVAEPQG